MTGVLDLSDELGDPFLTWKFLVDGYTANIHQIIRIRSFCSIFSAPFRKLILNQNHMDKAGPGLVI